MIHRSAHLLAWRTVIKNRFLSPEQTNPPALVLRAACQRYLRAVRKGHVVTRGKQIANTHGIMGKQTTFQA